MENERAEAKGLKPDETYAAIRNGEGGDVTASDEDSAAAEMEVHHSGKIDTYNDPFMRAAGHALIDFIRLPVSIESPGILACFKSTYRNTTIAGPQDAPSL